MEYVVDVEKSGGVWRVTLSRPDQGNALSPDLIAALDDTFRRAEGDGAEAVVLQGAGRHFCTGFDLSDVATATNDSMLARFVRIELLLQRVARAPFLTVSVARGRAIGAGADLFAACSLRLVDGDASFAFPGAKGFGLVLGTRRLSAITGHRVALDWIQSARAVRAAEAVDAGLVSAIVTGQDEADSTIARAVELPRWIRHRLGKAVEPASAEHDARDIELLVRSAAEPGLRDRIAAYVERNARARNPRPS